MWRLRLKAGIILFFLAAVALASADDPQPTEYVLTSAPGTYHLRLPARGEKPFEVALKIISFRERFPNGLPAYVAWRTEGHSADELIGEMKVTINGHDAAMSLADYDYLGDPDSFRIYREGRFYVIEMKAGDAAGSYTVKWFFRFMEERLKVFRKPEYLLVKRERMEGESGKRQETREYFYP